MMETEVLQTLLRMVAVIKDYPTPAPNTVSIRRSLRAGKYLIILNISGHSASGFSASFTTVST